MADIVNLQLETLIPDLVMMNKLKLFSKAEISIIKEKRKQYEYRLQRVSKSKDDIMKYIQYEMDLIKVIRQKTADKGMHQKKHNFEFTIINHVTKLYDLAIRRFSSDLRIWLSYIKFCKQVRFFSCASRLLEQLLQLHGAEMPSLYKLAANWEWKESHSIDRSRKYIHQGLRLHKDSKLIYTEAFRLELQFANVKRLEAAAKGLLEEGKEATDPMLRGQLAEVIYDSAITKIRDVTFLVELLNIADEHNFTAALRDKILEGMKTNFPNEEVTWDALARRELDLGGILKERIEKCIATYRESVVKIPTPKMWGLYLDYVLQLTDDIIALPNFKKNCLRNAFEAGHNAQMLSEKNYLTWIRKVEDTEIEKVAEWGTERYPDSIKLWAWRLRYHLSKAEEPAALKIFKEAISKPNLPDQITIWSLMLKYYQITDPTKAETLWREGSGNMQVGKTLKGKYIEWLAVTRGIVAPQQIEKSNARSNITRGTLLGKAKSRGALHGNGKSCGGPNKKLRSLNRRKKKKRKQKKRIVSYISLISPVQEQLDEAGPSSFTPILAQPRVPEPEPSLVAPAVVPPRVSEDGPSTFTPAFVQPRVSDAGHSSFTPTFVQPRVSEAGPSSYTPTFIQSRVSDAGLSTFSPTSVHTRVPEAGPSSLTPPTPVRSEINNARVCPLDEAERSFGRLPEKAYTLTNYDDNWHFLISLLPTLASLPKRLNSKSRLEIIQSLNKFEGNAYEEN